MAMVLLRQRPQNALVSAATAVVTQQCRDCGATAQPVDGDTEQVVAALLAFREEHRYCSYGAPFGPVPRQRRSRD